MKVNELICCPKCKENLIENYSEKDSDHLYSYSCAACGNVYPLIDGVTDFLPHVEQKSRAQQTMESERIVSIYESKLWRASPFISLLMRITLEDEISLIKKIINLDHINTILDLACGTGLHSRNFANENLNSKIIGLDLSWPMLKFGVKKADENSIENINFMHGDAHHIPLKDESMDAVNCCGALHLFPDVPKALDEIHRVTKPGGCFSAAVLLNGQSLFRKTHAYFTETFYGIHFFQIEEYKELLHSAGFEPAIYHAKGIWMIAGGIRSS
jgi:ubiquinone/menaquinone biosynthesis C-methylase UbiE/uncharacterized protein YbaR (Trm112 family)